MQDNEIVELFWQRNQSAISWCGAKYGRCLENTSYSILKSEEDAKECVQDTYLAAWNSMPNDRPDYLGSYLLKIVRNISIDLYRRQRAKRRFGGEELIYEELSECIPDNAPSVFDTMENGALARIINAFLKELESEKRIVFVRRYFYSDSIADISQKMNISQSKIKSMLMRMRQKLEERIRSEGFYEYK